MKFKEFFFSILLLFFSFTATAQNRSKKFDIESIKSDTTYFWGMNQIVNDQDEAEGLAINELYNNIANNCKADAIYAGKGDQKTQLNLIIKTFENKIKEKMHQIPIVDDFENEEYSYFIYIKRSDFRDICNDRKKSINRLALKGYNSDNDAILQFEDALRSYYWGMMLCLAHPQGNSLEITIEDEKVLAYEWFVNRIDGGDGVLKSFSFIVPKEGAFEESGDNLIVNLNTRSTTGTDISNLQFKYYNGQSYVPTSVNNGRAIVVIPKNNSSINIRIEYEFMMESTIDPEVNRVLNLIKHNIKFKNEKHTINIAPYLKEFTKKEEISLGEISDIAENIEDKEHSNEWRKIDKKFNVKNPEYLSIMQEIETALRNNNYESVRHHFSSESYGMLDTLSKYGEITIVGKQDYSFMKLGEQVLCRDIDMLFNFKNHVSFNREVVFRFDHTTKKVSSLAFRLSSITEKDIITKTAWPEEARLVLINFLEDYQTAYALKRHDYLESIYSADALIIVGHVIKKTVIPDRVQFNISEDEVRLMQHDKETYFANLSRTFKSQDYINVRFAETEFTRAKSATNKEVYGIRLLQEYYSSTYGDIGYLFLLVDLTDNTPLIHVRAWQPDEVDLEKLMGMKDLRF
ncbi:MAG: hypothetical protein IJZ87_00245 [Bacteroidales bacterium]|nr:hypothetical protein [Bacteroidales bacterium]